MNKYFFQQKILSLTKNAIINKGEVLNSFTREDVKFSHWDFNHKDGWINDSWIAECEIEASNWVDAYNIFRKKLLVVIPRIAFIGQCYIDFLHSSFLVIKNNKEYLAISKNFAEPVSMMFMERDLEALDLLIDSEISKEFFYYWSEAVNTSAYTAKLFLMFSAVENLAKGFNAKEYKKVIEEIVGNDLYFKIWKQRTGLRHRLFHGEYLTTEDTKENIVEVLHKKIIEYFNKDFFKKKLLTEEVVHPHRNYKWLINESAMILKKKTNKAEKISIKNIEKIVEQLSRNKACKYTYDHNNSFYKNPYSF